MALIQMDFHSETLKRTVPVNIILPFERFSGPFPTLYLLHGLTDNANGWLSYSRIRLWAEESGLAVVMPSGENSFYMDILVKDGCLGDFGEYVGRELVEVTREVLPLSRKREDTFLGGLSMGGFGACRNALKYWKTFGKAAVLSGALHVYEYPADWVETQGNTIGEVRNFGNLEETRNTDRNPRYLIREIQNDPEAVSLRSILPAAFRIRCWRRTARWQRPSVMPERRSCMRRERAVMTGISGMPISSAC